MNKNRDLEARRAAVAALLRSSSRRMLRANLNFINDYFVRNPSSDLPERLRPEPDE